MENPSDDNTQGHEHYQPEQQDTPAQQQYSQQPKENWESSNSQYPYLNHQTAIQRSWYKKSVS